VDEAVVVGLFENFRPITEQHSCTIAYPENCRPVTFNFNDNRNSYESTFDFFAARCSAAALNDTFVPRKHCCDRAVIRSRPFASTRGKVTIGDHCYLSEFKLQYIIPSH